VVLEAVITLLVVIVAGVAIGRAIPAGATWALLQRLWAIAVALFLIGLAVVILGGLAVATWAFWDWLSIPTNWPFVLGVGGLGLAHAVRGWWMAWRSRPQGSR
jgi:hypothetical protein